MKKPSRQFILIWSLFVASIFLIGVLSQKWNPETTCFNSGTPEEICKTEQVDFWRTSAKDFVNYGSGMGDVTNYLKIAEYFIGERKRDVILSWATYNWPPGFPAIVALVLKLTGPSYYFPKLLFVLSLALGFLFSILYHSIPLFSGRPVLRFFTWLSIFLLPDFRFQTVQFAYIASEGWAITTFVLALVALRSAGQKLTVSSAVWAGVALALASYMRALVDTLNSLTLTLLVAAAILAFLFEWIRQRKRPNLSTKSGRYLQLVLIIFAVQSILVAPWKFRNYKMTKIYSLCSTSDSVFRLHWTPTDKAPGWIKTSNVACRLAENVCAEVNTLPEEAIVDYRKGLTVSVFFANPVKWIIYRLKTFNSLWVGFSYKPSSWSDGSWWMAWIEGLFYLGMGIFAGAAFLSPSPKSIKNKAPNILFRSYALFFILANLAVFLVAPYEHRYSFFLRILFVYVGLVALGRKKIWKS